MSITVPREDADRAVKVAHEAAGGDVSIEPAIAKLSVLGVGMRSHTGVATRMFAELAQREINIALINTSEVRVNVAVAADHGREGLEALRAAFGFSEQS